MVAYAKLQGIRAFLSLNAADSHPVIPNLGNGGLAHIHIYIRRPVVGRVMYFIQELLLAALLANDTAAVRGFRNVHGILCQFRNGESQFIHPRHVPPVIHIVSARSLAAAFQEMPCHDTPCQVIPVVIRPSEFIFQWRKKECAVSRTPCHYHISALCQAAFNPFMPDISIYIINLIQNLMEIPVIVKIGESPPILD